MGDPASAHAHDESFGQVLLGEHDVENAVVEVARRQDTGQRRLDEPFVRRPWNLVDGLDRDGDDLGLGNTPGLRVVLADLNRLGTSAVDDEEQIVRGLRGERACRDPADQDHGHRNGAGQEPRMGLRKQDLFTARRQMGPFSETLVFERKKKRSSPI